MLVTRPQRNFIPTQTKLSNLFIIRGFQSYREFMKYCVFSCGFSELCTFCVGDDLPSSGLSAKFGVHTLTKSTNSSTHTDGTRV